MFLEEFISYLVLFGSARLRISREELLKESALLLSKTEVPGFHGLGAICRGRFVCHFIITSSVTEKRGFGVLGRSEEHTSELQSLVQ